MLPSMLIVAGCAASTLAVVRVLQIRGATTGRLGVLAAVAIASGISAASVGIYLLVGKSTAPSLQVAPRTPDSTATQVGDGHLDLREAAARLKSRLDANPKDAQGWLLYAHTTAKLDRWGDAANAYKNAIDLGQKGLDIQTGYAEMLVLRERGIVTPEAQVVLANALATDPKNDVARYYMALAAGQAGDAAKAIDLLQTLLADLRSDSTMRTEIGKRIAEAANAAGLPVPALAQGIPAGESTAAGGGPDSIVLDSVANMAEGTRDQVIGNMVDRLAARLASAPNDPDGWMQLGRAYAVLGQGDKAADAYEQASNLRPDDMGIPLQATAVLLDRLHADDPLPPRAIALLRKVAAVEPERPEVLWYLGVAAARDGNPTAARGSWTRLLTILPADGDDAKMVSEALDALPR